MKWYRSNIDKSIKRTKYGFFNPVFPYVENSLFNHLNESLEIVGFGDDFFSDDYRRPSQDCIKYNMFNEDFLLKYFNNFRSKISYNIVTNEVLLKNNEIVNLFNINDNDNLFLYCNQLMSCLQYDRRLSAIISGIYNK
jgi:hypothetical protein